MLKQLYRWARDPHLLSKLTSGAALTAGPPTREPAVAAASSASVPSVGTPAAVALLEHGELVIFRFVSVAQCR